MKVIKEGGRRLPEEDVETSRLVAGMLRDLRRNGMEAVRRYSRKLDDWDPPCFEMSERQIGEAIDRCGEQIVRDTDVCQGSVRAFAEAQLETLKPLEVEIRPGVLLGHRHIPAKTVGCASPATGTRRSARTTFCRRGGRLDTPAACGWGSS
jgi:sulfopropanediol 3-dehydrogenase